jgi:hypothetical protein
MPPYMYWKQGSSEWLTEGRLPALIIYECLVLAQIEIAVGIKKKRRMVGGKRMSSSSLGGRL